MTLANKYRLFTAMIPIDMFLHVLAMEKETFLPLFFIGSFMIHAIIIYVIGIYFLNQKCLHCQAHLYDRSDNLKFSPHKGEKSIFSFFGTDPFSYLMFTGKCHHCQKKI